MSLHAHAHLTSCTSVTLVTYIQCSLPASHRHLVHGKSSCSYLYSLFASQVSVFAPQDKDLITDQLRTAVERGQQVCVVGINLAKNNYQDAYQLLAGGRSWFYLDGPIPESFHAAEGGKTQDKAAYELGSFVIEGQAIILSRHF